MTPEKIGQKLQEIISNYGKEICLNRQRCKSLVKDLFPELKLETNLLIVAMDMDTVARLLDNQTAIPSEILIPQLIKHLQENAGISQNNAEWAVNTWAFALGIKCGKSFSNAPTQDSPVSLTLDNQISKAPSGNQNCFEKSVQSCHGKNSLPANQSSSLSTLSHLQHILEFGSLDDRVKLLQDLFHKDNLKLNEELFEIISRLTNDGDLGLRFWAKKLYARFNGNFLPQKSSETRDNKDFKIEQLIAKLNAAKNSSLISLDTIKKLFETRDSRIIPPLAAYLNECHDAVQISYVTRLIGVTFPDNNVLQYLEKFLNHSDERVIANTLEGIEAIGTKEAAEKIALCLSHRNNRVRANAAKILARLDADRATTTIVEMLQMGNQTHYIASACYAVKCLKNDVFIGYVEPLLKNDLLINDAIAALTAIGGQQVADIFLNAYEDAADPQRKKLFYEAIKSMGGNFQLPPDPVAEELHEEQKQEKAPDLSPRKSMFQRFIGFFTG